MKQNYKIAYCKKCKDNRLFNLKKVKKRNDKNSPAFQFICSHCGGKLI